MGEDVEAGHPLLWAGAQPRASLVWALGGNPWEPAKLVVILREQAGGGGRECNGGLKAVG